MSDVNPHTVSDPADHHLKAWHNHKLHEHLLALWRTNQFFFRVVEMDRIISVNRGEQIYCTRFIEADGNTAEEEGTGIIIKGYAGPGSFVRFTQHHTICYTSWQALWNGLKKAGFKMTFDDERTMKTKGELYLTNGMDNRIHWAMEIDAKTRRLLANVVYTTTDILHQKETPIKKGDYLCVNDELVKYEENGMEGRRLKLTVTRIRSKAYGQNRFRWLSTLR